MHRKEGRKIFYLLKDINHLLKDSMRNTFDKTGFTAPQIMVLATLGKNGPMKISELGEALGLSNSTISGIVDRLEKNNHVVRTRSKEDRRVVHVSINRESEKMMHAAFHERLEEKLGQKLLGATQEELEAIIKGLEALKGLFKNN